MLLSAFNILPLLWNKVDLYPWGNLREGYFHPTYRLYKALCVFSSSFFVLTDCWPTNHKEKGDPTLYLFPERTIITCEPLFCYLIILSYYYFEILENYIKA